MSARRVLGACAAAAGSLIVVTGLAGAAPGDLDPTFGTGGKVMVPIATYGAGAQGSAVQADNKLVLVGTNYQMAPPPPPPSPYLPHQEDEDFFALRLTESGSVDSSFGSGGIVRTPIDLEPGARDVARGVAIAPDGKIVVVGDAWRINQANDLALVRYTPTGALDPTFSDDGILTIDLVGFGSIGYAVVVQPDGKAVAVGATTGYAGFETVRLNVDGTLDPSFGGDGVVRTLVGDPSLNDDSSAVALDGDRIVVAGSADYTSSSSAFAVARYLSDGQLDPSFGSGGVVVTPGPRFNVIRGVAVTSDGKIMVAGAEVDGTGGVIRVARYLQNGALDTTFGGTGIVTTAVGGYAYGNSLVLEPDGKAIVGADAGKFALVRYNDDGSLDGSFGEGGIRTYAVGTPGGSPTSLVIQHLAEGRDRLVQTGTAWDAGGEFAAAGVQVEPGGPPPPPPPPPSSPPPPPPPVPEFCHVPRVVRLRLARARVKIRRANCRVGEVRSVKAKRRFRGIVVAQSPRAGRSFRAGSRVNLVVGRR